MAPRALYQFGKMLLRNAFVLPWQNIVRAKILIIGFLANLGYGTLSFTLNYDLAGAGIEASLTYQVLRSLLMGYLIFPFTFWLHARFQSRFLLLFIQLLGLSLYFIDRSSGLMNAFAVSLAFGPFGALHNYRFAKNQSRDNRGSESALNIYLIIFGYSCGLFAGGVLLQHDYYYHAVIGGSLCTIIGAFFLYHQITAKDNLRKVYNLIGFKKPSSRISFFYGLYNATVDGCMPVWMRELGISALGAGFNMSIRPIIGLMLTPIVGWLIDKQGFRTAQIGGVCIVLGWVLMAGGIHYAWLLALSMGVLSIGSNLVLPMEVSRWYKRRSSAGTISRELLVVSGRAPSYLIGIMICFLMPAAFPLFGLTISGLFMFGTRPTRKGMGRRLAA